MPNTSPYKKIGRPSVRKKILYGGFKKPVHIRTYLPRKASDGNDYVVDVAQDYSTVMVIVEAAVSEGRTVTIKPIEQADVLYTKYGTDNI